uniref:RRM domain-containing protein n=1 Tax=Neovison vison TaxID=452646 RepID=A0A8C7EL97_NEOVI
ISSEEGKLFVGGLNFRINKQDLEDHFSSSGPISEQSRGFNFTTFTKLELVSDARRTMNGESLDGHQIHMDLSGKSARGTRGSDFGAQGQGCSYSRGGGDQGYRSGRYDDLEDMDMEGQSTLQAGPTRSNKQQHR